MWTLGYKWLREACVAQGSFSSFRTFLSSLSFVESSLFLILRTFWSARKTEKKKPQKTMGLSIFHFSVRIKKFPRWIQPTSLYSYLPVSYCKGCVLQIFRCCQADYGLYHAFCFWKVILAGPWGLVDFYFNCWHNSFILWAVCFLCLALFAVISASDVLLKVLEMHFLVAKPCAHMLGRLPCVSCLLLLWVSYN